MAQFIMDVADVTFTRKSDGHTVFTSEAQLASLSQTVDEETIRGGIGSRSIYTIKSNKEVELSVRNATFDLEWLAMTQGVEVKEGDTMSVKESATATVEGGSVTVEGAEGTVAVLNSDRVSEQSEVGLEGSITVSPDLAADGEEVTVIYQKEVTGRSVEMRADTFSEKYEVQYKTVVYESENETVDGHMYIVFKNVTPSSAFEMSLENGSAFTPELSFRATADKSGTIGKMFYSDEEAAA